MCWIVQIGAVTIPEIPALIRESRKERDRATVYRITKLSIIATCCTHYIDLFCTCIHYPTNRNCVSNGPYEGA